MLGGRMAEKDTTFPRPYEAHIIKIGEIKRVDPVPGLRKCVHQAAP